MQEGAAVCDKVASQKGRGTRLFRPEGGLVDLYVFGAGQIAEVCAYYFREEGRFRRYHFVVDPEYLTDTTVDGLPVLTTSEALERARPGEDMWFTAMSAAKRNTLRQARAESLRAAGFELASFVHPSALLWNGFVVPGNTMIMENNILQYKSSIGPNSIVWSSNHIGHHTAIGANTFLASEVVISGSCQIGDNCFFGVNATVFDNIAIGNKVIVGAGAVIREDVVDNSVIR